jgi:hypothetical protein
MAARAFEKVNFSRFRFHSRLPVHSVSKPKKLLEREIEREGTWKG